MDPTEFSERITVREKVEKKHPNGEVTYDWVNKLTVWGKVIPISGNESFQGDKKTASEKFKIRVRHREDIGFNDQVLWSGMVMDIVSVMPHFKHGRNKIIEIKTEFFG